jgi:hypothetical protein
MKRFQGIVGAARTKVGFVSSTVYSSRDRPAASKGIRADHVTPGVRTGRVCYVQLSSFHLLIVSFSESSQLEEQGLTIEGSVSWLS